MQGFGTIDGERFYFRYRHDDAQLHVGPPEEPVDPLFPDMPQTRLYAEIRDVTSNGDGGSLTKDEALELIRERLFPALRPIEEVAGTTYADRLQAEVDYLVKRYKVTKPDMT